MMTQAAIARIASESREGLWEPPVQAAPRSPETPTVVDRTVRDSRPSPPDGYTFVTYHGKMARALIEGGIDPGGARAGTDIDWLESTTSIDDGDPVNLLATESTSTGSSGSSGKAANSYDIELPGRGSLTIRSLNDDPETLQAGYARIDADSPVGVEVVFRLFAGQKLVTTTSILPVDPQSGFSMLASANDFARSGLALLNPAENGAPAEVTATLLNQAGDRVDESTITLASGQKIAKFIDEDIFFPDLAAQDFDGSADIRSTQPVVPTVIRLEDNRFFTTQTVQPITDNENDSMGFAPKDQAAFDDLVVGKRVVSGETNYIDFVSPDRFSETDGADTWTGAYTYVNTGPNTGAITWDYDRPFAIFAIKPRALPMPVVWDWSLSVG